MTACINLPRPIAAPVAAAVTLDSLSADAILAYVEEIAIRVERRYGSAVPREDLVAFGVMGFLDATRRFDPTQGCSLEAFANRRVRGAMVDGARKWSQYRSVCQRANRQATRAAAAGRPPVTTAEEASVFEVDDVLHAASSPTGASNWSEQPIREVTDAVRDVNHHHEREDVGRRLASLVASLPAADRALLHEVYREERSLAEVGRELGKSRAAICRWHARIIEGLRDQLGL